MCVLSNNYYTLACISSPIASVLDHEWALNIPMYYCRIHDISTVMQIIMIVHADLSTYPTN